MSDFDLYVAAADRSWNSAVISRAVANTMLAGTGGMRDWEEKLRQQDSKTYLVARPADQAPPDLRVVDFMTGEPADFFLWVCLHGAEEAQQVLGEVSFEENLQNLERCGVMMLPD